MSFVTNGQEQQVIVKMGNETSQPVGGEDQSQQNAYQRREMSFDELRQLAAAGEKQSPTTANAPNSMQAASTVLMASPTPTQATGTIQSTAANTLSPEQRLNGVVVNGDAKLNASAVTPTARLKLEAPMKIGEQIDEAIAEIKKLSPSSSPAAVEFRISVSAETVAVPEAPSESQATTGKSTPINVQPPTAAVASAKLAVKTTVSPALGAKSPTTSVESPSTYGDLQSRATVSPKSPAVTVASAEPPAEAAAVSKTASAVTTVVANKSPEQSIVPSEAPAVTAATSELQLLSESPKAYVEKPEAIDKPPAVVAKSPTNSTVSNESTAVASATAESKPDEAKLPATAVESPQIATSAAESQTVSTESTAVSKSTETPAAAERETADEVASSDAKHIERSPKIKATEDEQPIVENKETLEANSLPKQQKVFQYTLDDLQKLNSPELASQPPKNAKIPIKIQVTPKSESKKAKKSKAPKQVESTSSTTSSNGNEATPSNSTSIANEPQPPAQSQAHKGAIPKVPKQVESTSSTTSSQPNESQPIEPILYLNPITLEADYFLKTINDNAENFSVLDPHLVDALETIMETINALLQRNQDRFIVETDRVKFVPKAEMRLLKRSFICSLCKEYVGNSSEKATAHLANCHAMEPKRKSKKQLKREKEEENQKKKEKKKEAKEKKAAAKEKEKGKESRSVSNSSASISKTTNEEAGGAAASTSKAAKTKQEKSAEVKAKEQAMLTNSKPKDEKQKQPSTGTQTQKPNQPSAGTQTQKPNQPSAGTQTQQQNKLEVQTQTNQTEGATKKKRERNKKQPGEAKHVSQQLPKKARALFSNNMQQFFVDHVQLATTLKHIPAYDRIESELMELLQKVFPNQTVKLFKFGSRISGVGTRDSDLDIYVDIDNNFINFENRPSSKTLSHISMVYSALMKTNQRWKHIVQIKNARVPILKVLNCSTSIECDIGFSNSLGYCNTKLVEYLLNLQPVARCLCIFLKKWLDRSKLSSVSSYSMTLMVIFYLQVNKLLPSVQSIQIGLTKKLYVGPWLGNFVEKTLEQWGLEEVQMSTQSVKLLLKNFFEFYLKFPYDKCVICPYLANLNIGIGEIHHIMPKRYADFVHGPVGREYPLEVDKKSIIVQDPLQLNHNVTKNITKLQLTLLKDYMEHSLRLFEEMR